MSGIFHFLPDTHTDDEDLILSVDFPKVQKAQKVILLKTKVDIT